MNRPDPEMATALRQAAALNRQASEPVSAPTATPSHKAPNLWRTLCDDVRCVFSRDPAARSTLEVVTIYPGVHALVLHRIAHRLWRFGWRYMARLISFFARLMTDIDIHPGATIGQRFFIDHGCGVVIGETANIGDDVTLYHGVTLGGTSWNPGKRHPTLESGVVVGAGAKILGPINIGRNARIAANSVVISDVCAEMTVVGIPGRMVLPKSDRRITAQGIDLDHHQMPDPVGKAISCLLERIDDLEKQIAVLGKEAPQTSSGCTTCNDTCTEPAFAAKPTP